MQVKVIRPATAEAKQWSPFDPGTAGPFLDWLAEHDVDARFETETTVSIIDAEGDRETAYPGDWIVRFDKDGSFLVVPGPIFSSWFAPA